MAQNLPPRLQAIVDDFKWCEGKEKIELLLDFSESMMALPGWLAANHDQMDQVHECMTPVFVAATMENGGMKFYFDVPRESPTIRGFAAILGEGLDGATPDEILHIPDDFYLEMGLQSVLTHQRLNGMSAILAHIKRLAVDHLPNGR